MTTQKMYGSRPSGSVPMTRPVMPRKPSNAAVKGKIGQAKGSPMMKTPSAAQAKAMKQKQDLKKRAISKSR